MKSLYFLVPILSAATVFAAPKDRKIKDYTPAPAAQECLVQREPLKCGVPAYNAPAAIDVVQKKRYCYQGGF